MRSIKFQDVDYFSSVRYGFHFMGLIIILIKSVDYYHNIYAMLETTYLEDCSLFFVVGYIAHDIEDFFFPPVTYRIHCSLIKCSQ